MRSRRSPPRCHPFAAALLLAACGSGGGDAPADPHAAFHAACVAKVNSLRATKALPPLARWQVAEPCVDGMATADETSGTPHGAWTSGPSSCKGSGQNECLGYGEAGIARCLDAMWAEKDQAGCAGCDGCAAGDQAACATCDFYGTTTHQVCGHYVNLRSPSFHQVACGMSARGGWSAINFQ
jgi:hypothetical protein